MQKGTGHGFFLRIWTNCPKDSLIVNLVKPFNVRVVLDSTSCNGEVWRVPRHFSNANLFEGHLAAADSSDLNSRLVPCTWLMQNRIHCLKEKTWMWMASVSARHGHFFRYQLKLVIYSSDSKQRLLRKVTSRSQAPSSNVRKVLTSLHLLEVEGVYHVVTQLPSQKNGGWKEAAHRHK